MAERRMGWLWGVLAFGLVLLAGCSSAKPLPVTGGTGQASVQSIEVVQSLSQPGEVRLLVKGALPDTCTQLVDPVVSRSGRLAVVIMLQQPLSEQKDCRAGERPFERVVSLGKDFTPGSYSISVNGRQQVFDLASPVTAASQPEVVQKEVVAPAAVELPGAKEQPAAVELPGAKEQPATVEQPAAVELPGTKEQPVTVEQPAAVELPGTVDQPASAAPALSETTSQPPAVPAAAVPGNCENKAAFFADVSVPDGSVFDPGQAFTKTWRVRNAGTCAWEGYAVVFQGGDPLSQQNRVTLAGTVAAGDTVDISINMSAPQKPGSYYSDWLIAASDGSTFGLGAAKNGLLWTKIGVRTLIPVTGGSPSCAYQMDSDAEAQVLEMINQARKERGLAALQNTAKLAAAARGHSQDMACTDFVEHYGSDGSTWYARIQAQGVRYRTASENIYAGNPRFGGTPEGAFNWWMNSQIHRDNILNPEFTQIGVGYIFYDGSTYKGYYTLNFVKP